MRRHVVRGVRVALLALFALFFIVPVVWLILAPTKSDAALVTSPPLIGWAWARGGGGGLRAVVES